MGDRSLVWKGQPDAEDGKPNFGDPSAIEFLHSFRITTGISAGQIAQEL
jgi:hypothetical protein